MSTQKPQKALRNLFTRTEPLEEEIKQPPAQDLKDQPKTNKSKYVAEKKEEQIDTKVPKYYDSLLNDRTPWKEDEYVSFIQRIDQAQTDAFFLKGKLISEVKEKFYVNNKRGWVQFCDETLNMNYTTANQYVRVALEFDVMSHQRKDFGFEHFKALLPLTKDQRDEFLFETPNNLSVKMLRELIAKKVEAPSTDLGFEKNKLRAKHIIETLQKLKSQLIQLKDSSLTQEEKWQLYGAFQNLSEEMNIISTSFTASPKIKLESRQAEA